MTAWSPAGHGAHPPAWTGKSTCLDHLAGFASTRQLLTTASGGDVDLSAMPPAAGKPDSYPTTLPVGPGRAVCRFLTGLVKILAKHAGTPSPQSWLRARYELGLSPTSSVKRELNEPSEEQPTAKQTSVTLKSPRRSSALARSIRRVIR